MMPALDMTAGVPWPARARRLPLAARWIGRRWLLIPGGRCAACKRRWRVRRMR